MTMRRLLERLDEIGSTIVPLAYLAGLFLGTASYFTGVRGWGVVLAVGIGLALGSELHSFLQQRRARAAFAEYRRIRRAGGDATDAQETFRINAYLLAALVGFQCFTATAFAAATWPVSGNWLEVAIQDGLRGCIIPAFFLLSGFLVPLTQSAAAVLTRGADEILHTAVARNVRHWRRRINRVHRRGGDLSPLMVALLQEAGEDAAARRTTLIAENLTLAETHMQPSWWERRRGVAPGGVVEALLPGQPPTGPGTPLPAPISRSLPDGDGYQSPWEMVPGFIDPYASRQDTSAPAASEQVERGKYTSGKLREMLVWSLLDKQPGMSRNAMMGALRAAGMGCRDETLRGIMTRWEEQRRGIRTLPARGVELSGEADEPEQRADRAV